MSAGTAYLLIVIPLSALALLLLIRGFRGRKVDDHRLCRRCGFDLFGTPASSTRCGECGADLNRRRATRIGHRKRRPVQIALGVAMVTLMIVGIIVRSRVQATGTRWLHYMPYRVVLHEMNSRDATLATAATDELIARYAASKLNKDQIERMIDRLLDRQLDESRPWQNRWGDWVQQAHADGNVPDPQWARFWGQLCLQFSARTVIRRGDPLILRLDPVDHYGMNGFDDIEWNLLRLRFDDIDLLQNDSASYPLIIGPEITHIGLELSGGYTYKGFNDVGFHGPLEIHLPAEEWSRLGDGQHTLRADIDFTAAIFQGSQAGVVAHVIVAKSLPIKVVSNDAAAVKLVVRPELREEMSKPSHVGLILGTDGDVYLYYKFQPVPISVVPDFFVRSGNKQWRLDDNEWSHDMDERGRWDEGLAVGNCAGIDPTHIDVIVRPSIDKACRTLDVTEIWGEEIVIPNVPVQISKPSGPTTRP